MIALDTGILVHARRAETEHHDAARELLKRQAEGSRPWAIPWPCVYEFIRVVTHPAIFKPTSGLDSVITSLESLFASSSLSLLGEGPKHPGHMARALRQGDARGNLAFDAHIAALVREHGIKELWTLDRDLARFSGIRAVNPFEDPGS